MDNAKTVKMYRERIIKDLMPDRCKIYPLHGTGATIVDGVMVSADPAPRTWRGVIDIPCRADLSRAFRPDRLKAQALEVDEYNLELPFDMVVEPSDIVELIDPNSGDVLRFEIRKRKNLSAFDGSIECVIDVAGVGFDANS